MVLVVVLYMDYTTPGCSTVNEFNILLFRNRNVVHLQIISNKKTELSCMLCGPSVTSAMLGIFGLASYLDWCVSWRQRQCCSLHITYSIDDFLAVRPSTFADIIVSATERF